nr:ferredoxin family protein [Bradyrhizobium sp. G127]
MYTDCVEVCPVDCFHIGEHMLVISQDDCIDCGVCVPECPEQAIKADSQRDAGAWIDFNAKYARLWPTIEERQEPPADAAEWAGKDKKFVRFFGTNNPADA